MGTLDAHDTFTNRLSDYLDGDLRADERAGLEAHLKTCAACTAVLTELRTVVARAGALPAPTDVPDLWPAIAARIAEDDAPATAPVARRREPRRNGFTEWRFSLTVPQLAAAAFALMLISGGTVWTILRSNPVVAPRDPGTAPIAGVSDSVPTPDAYALNPTIAESTAAPAPRTIIPPAPGSRAVVAGAGGDRYDRAIADLQAVLVEHRSELDPKTIEILETNLAIIDQAIEQARRALAADPASSYLHGHIAENMKRKYELLRRAASAVTAVQS